MLNPYSEKRDTALSLPEYPAGHISGKDALFMFPNRGNEGVRRSNYESTRRESLDKIADLKAQPEANDSEIERQQQEAIEYEQEFPEKYDNADGWEISPEDVVRYRSCADHMAVEYDETVGDDELDLQLVH